MTSRSAIWALALLSFASIGVGCGGGGGGNAEVPKATISFEISSTQLTLGTAMPLNVVIDATGKPLQAFDFDIVVSNSTLFPLSATPHAEFDDDGELFLTPSYDFLGGTISDVVDCVHGPSQISGPTRVITFWIYPWAAGPATVAIAAATVASPDGSAHSVSTVTLDLNVVAP